MGNANSHAQYAENPYRLFTDLSRHAAEVSEHLAGIKSSPLLDGLTEKHREAFRHITNRYEEFLKRWRGKIFELGVLVNNALDEGQRPSQESLAALKQALSSLPCTKDFGDFGQQCDDLHREIQNEPSYSRVSKMSISLLIGGTMMAIAGATCIVLLTLHALPGVAFVLMPIEVIITLVVGGAAIVLGCTGFLAAYYHMYKLSSSTEKIVKIVDFYKKHKEGIEVKMQDIFAHRLCTDVSLALRLGDLQKSLIEAKKYLQLVCEISVPR